MRIPYQSTIYTALSAAILCSVLLSGCNIPTSTPAAPVQNTQAASTKIVPTSLPTPRAHAEQLVTPPGKIIEPTAVALPMADTGEQLGESIFGASVSPADESGGLKQISEVGLKWTRIGLLWQAVEPAKDQLDWAQAKGFEQEVKNSVQAGINVVGILLETPNWAVKPGFPCGVIDKSFYSSFARFASEAVQRYSQPPYHIKYWEIYNEPDAPNALGCWGDPSDRVYYGGQDYGRMLQVVYPAMKAANPDVQVLVGGLLMDCDPVNPPDEVKIPGQKRDCTPGRFFEGALASGAVNSFDGVAFHSYDYYVDYGVYYNPGWNSSRLTSGSSAVAKAAYLRSVMTKYNVKDRYLINTEFAVFCGRAGSTACDPFLDKVEATKAYYAVQFMATAMAEDFRVAIWYSALDNKNNGLLNKDLSPKPALYAMEFTNKLIGQARFVQTFSDASFIVQEFNRAGQKIWVVWTKDNQPHTLDLPSIPASVFVIGPDGKGYESDAVQHVDLDVEPAFILFPTP